MDKYYIKTRRDFTVIRKYAWLFTLLVAIGGLIEPKLGLLVIFIMAGLMITAFFRGRYWCGNICPHGSLFDMLILPISENRKIPEFLKSKFFIVGFFVFFMINFSRKILNVVNQWGTFDFMDKLGFVFVSTYLMVLIVGSILAVFITPRTWCQFCPMGTMQKLSYKLGKFVGVADKTERYVTISNLDKCIKCGKCSKVCPFQLTPHLEFDKNNRFSNIDCIKCSTCIKNCPLKLLSM
ncbi:MAG: 4Fe-4S binding protein [Tepidanaerobacteraceae bacterium]|jgi:ferredoxin-type protein NapH